MNCLNLQQTGNVDLVLASNGIKVDYADAVTLDLNDVIDTSQVSPYPFVQKAIEHVEQTLSDSGVALTLENSHLEITQDTETEIKIESVIIGEPVSIHYRTPTSFNLSLPDFDGVELSNLLSSLIGEIPGIDPPTHGSLI